MPLAILGPLDHISESTPGSQASGPHFSKVLCWGRLRCESKTPCAVYLQHWDPECPLTWVILPTTPNCGGNILWIKHKVIQLSFGKFNSTSAEGLTLQSPEGHYTMSNKHSRMAILLAHSPLPQEREVTHYLFFDVLLEWGTSWLHFWPRPLQWNPKTICSETLKLHKTIRFQASWGHKS